MKKTERIVKFPGRPTWGAFIGQIGAEVSVNAQPKLEETEVRYRSRGPVIGIIGPSADFEQKFDQDSQIFQRTLRLADSLRKLDTIFMGSANAWGIERSKVISTIASAVGRNRFIEVCCPSDHEGSDIKRVDFPIDQCEQAQRLLTCPPILWVLGGDCGQRMIELLSKNPVAPVCIMVDGSSTLDMRIHGPVIKKYDSAEDALAWIVNQLQQHLL